MRASLIVNIAIGIIIAMFQPLLAQDFPGDPASGRIYTIDWCSDCHPAERSADNPGLAPDFTSIAALPSTTALSLRAFFQSNHDRMPDFMLNTAEADDIIAYILSLKRK
jgi:mono/diheme cytochrome c family protein